MLDEQRPMYIGTPAIIQTTLNELWDIGCHYSDRPLPIDWSVRQREEDGLVEITGRLTGLEIEETLTLSFEGARMFFFDSAYTIAELLERRMRAQFGGRRGE